MTRQPPNLPVLQAVMQDVDCTLDELAQDFDPVQLAVLGNALLNVAVGRLIAEDGSARTAALLHRLADLVASRPVPQGEDAFALTGTDA